MTPRGESPWRMGCKEQQTSSGSERRASARGPTVEQPQVEGMSRSATAPARRNRNFRRLQDIEVIGDTICGKKDGVIRLLYENFDGLPVSTARDRHGKISRLNLLRKRLDLDIIGGTEVQIDWSLMDRRNSLETVLDDTARVRAATGFNTKECVGKRQQGGTCTLAFDAAAVKVVGSGSDASGLGRWSWLRVVGCQGAVTRIITAYQPVRARKKGFNTVYRQHLRHFKTLGRIGCPRNFFRMDLRQFLLQCLADGEKIILMLDANENMETGKLARLFRSTELDLVDAVRERSGVPGPPTWFRGSHQIDGVWVSRGITIQRAAFLPFFLGIGDHRPILVDFSSEDVLQERSVRVKIPEMRRLQCDNPEVLSRYTSRLEDLCTEHKLVQKLQALSPIRTTLGNVDWILGIEGVDRTKRDFMRAAEKFCRRLRTGGIPYSPELEVAKRRVWVWKKVIYRKEGGRIQKKYVRRRARSCGIQNPFRGSLEEARRKLQIAEKEYETLLPQAPDLRERFLLRQRREDDEDATEKEARAAMKKKEDIRLSWRVIRKSLGRGHMGSVKVVEVLRNGSWTRVTSRREIEESIMQENSKRFRLTEGTPLMTALAKAMFGQLADSVMVEQILNGEFDYDSVEPDVAQFFRLFASARAHPISAKISKDDFQQYWKKARERTASSISGLHFGHYKAAASSDLLSLLHASIIDSAFNRGYPLSRWTKGLSCMLEKEEGVIKVDKLRAILLLEADFNFATKLLVGKRMVETLEFDGALAEEQFGSRKQRSSIEVALNRRLLSDISRQKRLPMAIAGVDAAHCYDRVAHPFAIMACRAIGVPKAVVQTIFGAVQKMKMRVRTAYGESQQWYGGDTANPFQGLCQGNGCGPAVWLVVSMFVVRFLKIKGRVSSILSCLSGAVVEILGLMFVDDSDLVHFASEQETPDQIADELNTTVQHWQTGLNISGGTLRPNKCYWYLLAYEWIDGTVRMASDTRREIFVRDANGVDGRVKYLEPHEAKEVVGVWIAPDGNSDAQMTSLMSKVGNMTSKLRDCVVPFRWMWKGFMMGMWKSIAYPLGACTLSEQECTKLASKVYSTVLPALGVNRNIPTVMRYAPLRFGGLNLPSPAIEQGIQQLRLLLEHGSEDTLSGKLLRISLEQMQLEVGELESVLSLPYKRFHHLATDVWIKHVWRFCSESGVKLVWNTAVLPLPLREWDSAIMAKCRAVGIRCPKQQRRINRVRCSLQVITLADITTADGRSIRQDVREGRQWTRRSKYQWGKEQPSEQDWDEWSRAMIRISNHNGYLPNPLGRWIAEPHLQHEWIWGVQDGYLYKYQGGRRGWWQRFSPTSTAGSVFVAGRLTLRSPEEYQVAQVEDLGEASVRWTSGTEVRYSTSATEVVETRQKEKLELWLRQHVRWHVELAWAIQQLRTGRCRIVSDGSYMKERAENLGAACWIIETLDQTRICSGGCLTSGGTANPYRAELTGLYGVLATLHWCLKGTELVETIEIGCDCKGALAGLRWTPRKTSCSTKHHDLRRAISHLQQSFGNRLRWRYIAGHQDDVVSWRQLSRWEQLNVLCDYSAKQLLGQSIAEGRPSQVMLPTEEWCCWAGGMRITGELHSKVVVAVTEKEMKEKLAKYGVLTLPGFNVVDWQVVDRSRAQLTQGMQVWLMKHTSGFCGSGAMMHRMKLWESQTCRCCLRQPEVTPWHILECGHRDMASARTAMLSELQVWMANQSVDGWLIEVLLRLLRDGGWPMEWDGSLDPIQLNLLQNMERIGVRALLLGYLPKGMVEWQKHAFFLMGSQRSAELLMCRLGTKLLEELHKLWKLRCDIVHEKDANGLYVEEGRDLTDRISAEYSQGRAGLLDSDFYLLDEPKEELLLKPLAVKLGWLRDILFARGHMEEARKIGEWLRNRKSRKRVRKTEEDLRQGKRRRDANIARQRMVNCAQSNSETNGPAERTSRQTRADS